MRKPDTLERLYLDFDGFFASVEQQARPYLRDKPVGVVPFEGVETTAIIAASKEAKKMGVKSVMSVKEAKRLCPSLLLVPQSPDLYRRAHHALLAEINAVIPVDAVKSIDELTCRLDTEQRNFPEKLSQAIKSRLAENIGPYISCSIGFAPNRHLAKIACKQDKPNGTTIWHPHQIPDVLYPLPFSDIPGIGRRMERRLIQKGVLDMRDLLNLQPKQMRKLWNNVTGERLWYALHGFDIQTPPSDRGMIGHSRVLPPEARTLKAAEPIARMLLIKAARRLRNQQYYAGLLYVSCRTFQAHYSQKLSLPDVCDDQAFLSALKKLWQKFSTLIPKHETLSQLSVSLSNLHKASERQLDLLLLNDENRQQWENVTRAVDHLNARYGKSLITLGSWQPPSGGNLGGKIAYTRIPAQEDFW